MPKTSSQLDGQEPEIINCQTFERPLTMTCPDCGGALKKFEVGSIVKFAATSDTANCRDYGRRAVQEMEKAMRAAGRFLNERAEFCLQMAEHGGVVDPEASRDWHAASTRALDRAYKLRDLVEQDWLTPETSPQLARREQDCTDADDHLRAAGQVAAYLSVMSCSGRFKKVSNKDHATFVIL